MLKLDEKKIRKGKPIGLPYQGSKKKISKKIVEIIKQNFGTGKPIYDIFGGGGAITAECMINGLDVHYNDLDETITEMFKKVILSDREYLKTLIVSREEFLKNRDKKEKSVDDNLKLLVNSFGNNRIGYLYSEEFSDIKYNLAIEIIKNHDTFSGYKETETYIKNLQNFKEQSCQKVQLQQLQQLGQLEKLDELKVTNLDYKDFSNVENAILYLDPPYEGGEGYGKQTGARQVSHDVYKKMRQKLLKMPAGSVIIEDDIEYKLGTSSNNQNRMYVKDLQIQNKFFDNKAFYNWAYEMSKNNIVLISSYTISDDRFGTAYEFQTARSTFQSGINQAHHEKLFMPLWQLEKYTSEQLILI